MPKLTKTAIEACQPAKHDIWLWDSELPGFGVRIQPSGRKTYVVRYRTRRNQQRKFTIARTCDMPPAQARDLARSVFASVAAGNDPAEAKEAAKLAPSLDDLLYAYMQQHARHYLKASSAAEYAKCFRLYVSPAIGSRRLNELKQSAIQRLHASMHDKPHTANRTVSYLSAAFAWGIKVGLATDNPCKGVQRFPERHRETVLSGAQISSVYDELDTGNYTPAFRLFVRLLLLTGCRRNEILQARTEWVDFDRSVLMLPDSKVGPRVIALPAAALDLIRQYGGRKWLIENVQATGPVKNVHPFWKRLIDACDLPGVRIHDLRHTFGSMGHMAGLSQRDIADLLGHRKLRTTERYLHSVRHNAVEVVARAIG